MRLLLPALLCLSIAVPLRAGILGDDYNEEENDDYRTLPMMRFSVDAGFSQWLLSKDSTLTAKGRAYIEDQKQGQDLSAEAVCYFLPRGGVGLTWIWFISRTEADNAVMAKGGPSLTLKERVSITYIGPSFWTRLRAGRFGMAHAGVGAGYLSLLDTWTANGVPHKVEASNYAIVTSVGWDYSFFRFIGIGINGRFLFSNIEEYTYDGEKVTIEDPTGQYQWYNVPLYRFELNGGLRFYF